MAPNNFNTGVALSVSQKLNQMISSSSRDYNAWRLLISEIETSSPEDIDTVSLAYDSFLSTFPLCHWHFEKYAHHKAKLHGAEEAIKIFERGVQVAMYSVGFWTDYFTFGTTCFKDPKDVRRLFGRALSFVGRDYFCHVLWDKYMKYEFNQEGWSFLAVSYIQALRFPTKKLQFYYNNFKQFVNNLGEEMGSEMTTSCELKNVSLSSTKTEISRDDISAVIKDMLESSDKSLEREALYKYRTIGEELYRKAYHMDKEIKCFETKIRRRYFHATQVDDVDDEINNWHHYLDFIEKQGNLDLAVSVYERCLIPCANYPEFWLRYVEFLESKGGRELALSALDRGTQIFLKNIPEVHVFNARYKERIGDINGARAALLLHDSETNNSFIENVVTTANLEKRLGNYTVVSTTYKKAIKAATEKQKLHILPTLYSHFARLTFLITGSVDTTRNVLLDGLRVVPHCKFLLEELIKFAMTHEGSNQVSIVNAVVGDSISPRLDEDEGLSASDREDISCLFLEFVDLCGTVEDVMKAWNRHVKLFPQFLRISNSNKSFISTKVLSDADMDRDRSYHVTVANQPSHSTLPLLQKEEVQGNLSTLDNNNNNVKETLPTLTSGKALALSNGQDIESAPRLSIQSTIGVFGKSSDRCEDNASDQVLHNHPIEDEPRPMDFGDQSQRSVQPVDKSSKPPASDGEALFDSLDVQPELKKQKLQVSLDDVPSRSHELTSMPCDEPEMKRDMPVPSENTPYDESQRDDTASKRYNTTNMPDPKVPPTTCQDPIGKDETVPAPGDSSSQLHTHMDDQKQFAISGLNDKMTPTDQELPLSATISNTTTGPSSASPQVSPYPQSTIEDASQQNQHQWQAQQTSAMNPMLQYQYNHQQFMQQYQQQQQIYMQYPYNQFQQYYVNQQPYQIQSQQQQHMNPYDFQGHQLNSMPYQVQQPMTSYQQGQGPQPSMTQAQAVAYQTYQSGYQNPELGHQYSNYQDMNHHTQSHDGSVLVQNQHVGPLQKKRDEKTEQHNQHDGPKLPH